MLTGFDPRQISIEHWLGIAGMLVLIGAIVWFRPGRPGFLRLVLPMIAIFLMIRIVIVGNPVSWYIYSAVLDAGDVGWRQYDLIKIQRDRYLAPRDGLRYLAVGSSQTEAIYGDYAQQHGDFDLFIVAAMMPMDFVLYTDEIVRRRPESVLLYLSDFDIAKQPSAEALVVSPIQGADLPSVVRQFLAHPGDAELERAMVELAVGEVLPEFRFRFVYRGIVDKHFKRVAGVVGRRQRSERTASTQQERVAWLRDSLGEEYVAFNLSWLEAFLRTMARHGIEVVIVEGHYHPAVSNDETEGLALRVHESLERLARALPGVRFLPQRSLGGFTAEDYQDLTHVDPDAGSRFSHRLIEVLMQSPAVTQASGGATAQSCIPTDGMTQHSRWLCAAATGLAR